MAKVVLSIVVPIPKSLHFLSYVMSEKPATISCAANDHLVSSWFSANSISPAAACVVVECLDSCFKHDPTIHR